MNKMDQSFQIGGRVTIKMAENGLHVQTLNFEELLSDDFDAIQDRQTNDEFRNLCISVGRWLLIEGYIKGTESNNFVGYEPAQLTSKGIAALQDHRYDPGNRRSVLDSTGGGKPLSENAYTKIGSFLGGFFGGAVKTIGS